VNSPLLSRSFELALAIIPPFQTPPLVMFLSTNLVGPCSFPPRFLYVGFTFKGLISRSSPLSLPFCPRVVILFHYGPNLWFAVRTLLDVIGASQFFSVVSPHFLSFSFPFPSNPFNEDRDFFPWSLSASSSFCSSPLQDYRCFT